MEGGITAAPPLAPELGVGFDAAPGLGDSVLSPASPILPLLPTPMPEGTAAEAVLRMGMEV